jgi:L-asparaginase
MIPMSIDEVEATMNFSQALGYLSGNIENGIYLAMHGVVVDASKLVKNRSEGKFLIQD